MAHSTIDFGIDLGTTNSEVAEFRGTTVEVIKNNENFENTPSAVAIDDKGRILVGRQAKELYASDEENACIEFKRQMGKAEPIVFKASGRKMLPEELSAEVLRQLKANVREFLDEDLTAAVITVPADFSPPQTDATNRAAQKAGIDVSPLLQEPVAAAIAYGFDQKSADRSRWLIYDLGGGTFDVALIEKRDGMLRWRGHGGNKYLGGKNIDSAIMQNILIPALLEQAARQQAHLPDFQNANPAYRAAFAHLKIQAEQAKIRLSRTQSARILIPELCKDANGRMVAFDFELQRSELNKVVEPVVSETLRICREMLVENKIAPGDIEKLVLVGGPTLTPYLRERLADPSEGLGIPLEFRVDPFTVVARGAAIFAGTQPLISRTPPKVGEYRIDLKYSAVGPETEPYVDGQVVSAGNEDLAGFTIEFVNRNATPPWRSGKLSLAADGRFLAGLWAEEGDTNTFHIEVCNATGTRQRTIPETFPYTVRGGGIDKQTLIHNVSVGLADNTVRTFFEKGTPLPARKRELFTTAVDALRGSPGDAIKIPVLSGNQPRADRNERIGSLTVPASRFKRDVPAGSKVDVVIHVDESRRFRTTAYIELLDEEFDVELIGKIEQPPVSELQSQVANERRRLSTLREKAADTGDAVALRLLQEIAAERLDTELDALVKAAATNQDALDSCASRLLDLQVRLDAVEASLAWPAEVAEAEKQIKFATDIVMKHGSTSDKSTLQNLVQEVRAAMERRDVALLTTRSGELGGFAVRIWMGTREFWVGTLAWLRDEKSQMRDQAAATDLFSRAIRASEVDDVTTLRNICQQLRGLLPEKVRQQASSYDRSTVW